MVSHHTGYNKILEIHTEDLDFVISSKKKWAGDSITLSSSVVVCGSQVRRIFVAPMSKDYIYNESVKKVYDLRVPVLFYEQTDYYVNVRSKHSQEISFWNENYDIRDKVGRTFDDDQTQISGIINFRNLVGFSDLIIDINGKRALSVRIEVYPSKISYKEDYQLMITDISEMACDAALDFLKKTYQIFSTGLSNSNSISVYFQILRNIFDKYKNAVNHILSCPNHKIVTEYEVVQGYRAKRTYKKSEKWIIHHQQHIGYKNGLIIADKVLAANKQVTYDTDENRFVKFILISTLKKIEEFEKRYIDSTYNCEEHIIEAAHDMSREIGRMLSGTFLKDVSNYRAPQSISLVFGMAPGYRELYKYFILLRRGLSFNGDVFKMSVKDTALLYEYWCFIKLYSLLKKEYQLISPDLIRVDSNGITIELTKGKNSRVVFCDVKTDDRIVLSYNPKETNTQTFDQKPDNVLELEKNKASSSYKYVFDAKYRIEDRTKNDNYPDPYPGPTLDDINTMHRYRDSIVYENKNSRFMFEKTMFGAYILFPYKKEDEYSESERLVRGEIVKGHRFYRSINSVNIGGLPFLPQSTKLVRKLLTELIDDSSESAFERASFPIGIDDKLTHVDWDKKDVLIGTFPSAELYDICYRSKNYYVREDYVNRSRLPIHYLALYKTNEKFNNSGEIRYFGEVIELTRLPGRMIKDISIAKENEDKLFYRITVNGWKDISDFNESGESIKPMESGFKLRYTNTFLLYHSEMVPELFLKGEEEYRFYHELKRIARNTTVGEEGDFTSFVYGDNKYLFSNGEIKVFHNGQEFVTVSADSFMRKPAQMLRRIQYIGESVRKTINV